MRAYNTLNRSSKKYTSTKSTKTYRKTATTKKYSSTKKSKWKTHKVRSGQTLYSIARKHRTSVSKLKRLNHLKSNKIIAGKRLRVR